MKKLLIALTISVATMTLAQTDNTTATAELTMQGSISHEKLNPSDKATVTLNRLPTDFAAFKKLYDTAAVEPQGAAALFVVALGLYRDNPDEGERAIAYTLFDKFADNAEKIPPMERSFLKQKLLNTDSYAQPYIPNAYFQGAVPSNGYTPSKPYTVNVVVNAAQSYQPLSRAQAFVIPLKLKTYGKDWNNNPNRLHHVAVIKPRNGKTYQILRFKDLLTGVLAPDLTDKK